MSHLTNGQVIVLAASLVAAELGVIGYLGLKLAMNRAADIRILCYLLSLASVSTLAGTVWAQAGGWIDGGGAFQGHAGAAINSFLSFMLDLNTDVYVLITISALIVVPQCLRARVGFAAARRSNGTSGGMSERFRGRIEQMPTGTGARAGMAHVASE